MEWRAFPQLFFSLFCRSSSHSAANPLRLGLKFDWRFRQQCRWWCQSIIISTFNILPLSHSFTPLLWWYKDLRNLVSGQPKHIRNHWKPNERRRRVWFFMLVEGIDRASAYARMTKFVSLFCKLLLPRDTWVLAYYQFDPCKQRVAIFEAKYNKFCSRN